MNAIILTLIFFALIGIIAFLFFKTDIGGSVAASAGGCVSQCFGGIIFIVAVLFVIGLCKYHIEENARISQGKIHQEQFKNVIFVNSQYKPYKTGILGGIFGDYPGEFSTSISGHQKLPACYFRVTFKTEYQQVSNFDYFHYWTDGETKSLVLDQKLPFEPTQIIAKISFPDSTLVIRETFSVDARGNLLSKGLVMEHER